MTDSGDAVDYGSQSVSGAGADKEKVEAAGSDTAGGLSAAWDVSGGAVCSSGNCFCADRNVGCGGRMEAGRRYVCLHFCR